MTKPTLLFTLSEAAAALNLAMQWPEASVTGVTGDTRTLQPGDMFIALSGTPSRGFTSSFASTGDGHGYVKMLEV